MTGTSIYLCGYPGSGKTTVADQLMAALSQAVDGQVLRVDTSHDVRLVRPWILGWRCLAHVRLFAGLVRLMRSTGNHGRQKSIGAAVKAAVKLVSHHHVARAFQRRNPPAILVMDEPDWHKLWSLLFPAERSPSPALLRHVVQLLMPRSGKGTAHVCIHMDVPIDDCIARAAARENPSSRFNRSSMSNGAWADLLRSDTLYGEIHAVVQRGFSEAPSHSYIHFTPGQPVTDLTRQILALQ